MSGQDTKPGATVSFIQRQGGFPSPARGALRLGWRHGLYCIGCYWALILLFAFGVMNLYWTAGLMVFVLLEKVLPFPVFSRALREWRPLLLGW
jgi:predicted metal-binding membrane protein